MWLFVFIGTFVCSSVSGNAGIGVVIRKCCRKSQSLVNVSDLNVTSEIYECLAREEMEEKYNVSNSPLKIGDNVDRVRGVPKPCDGLEIFHLYPEKLDTYPNNENESCYEKLVAEVVKGSTQHNIPRVVTLTCYRNETENSTEKKITIEQMRKCCPKGQSYDTKSHICRVTDDNSTKEWVIENIQKKVTSDLIYEVKFGLPCKYVEVEVSEKLFDFDLQGSSLNASKKNGTDGGVASRGEWCLDREYGEPGLVARVCTQDCSSYGAYCLRKCCPIGQYFKACNFKNIKCVQNADELPFDSSVYINDLKKGAYTGVLGINTEILVCPSGKLMESDSHQLTPEGNLITHNNKNETNYCFEVLDRRHCLEGNINTTITTCICFIKGNTTDDSSKFRIKAVLNTISCVCLVMTLIVYVSQRELRNLHGQMLICHAFMMFVACSCLARAQYNGIENNTLCTALGYCIYFGFTAAFAWLNVMCIDIWSTLTTMERRKDESKRFIWYSLYAWSVALLLTVTVFLLDRYSPVDFLDANMGVDKCWFGRGKNLETDWPHIIFFVIPMGLITCTNFVLFLLTARHCARVKSEVHDHLAKYVITAKLWVIMGAGWVAELLSTIFSKPELLWTIIDHVNELQGLFIFLVLICKPKLYYQIRKWLKLEVVTIAREPMTFSTKPSGSKSSNRQTEDEAQSKWDAIKKA